MIKAVILISSFLVFLNLINLVDMYPLCQKNLPLSRQNLMVVIGGTRGLVTAQQWQTFVTATKSDAMKGTLS